MDKRAFKNFITKRSSIWTISLCMTGILVLGGIAAVNQTRQKRDTQQETELDQLAYLEEEQSLIQISDPTRLGKI